VLGRTGFLRGSSGCLNTGSCSFLLVVARETRELVLVVEPDYLPDAEVLDFSRVYTP
jgi:hypothetical protein